MGPRHIPLRSPLHRLRRALAGGRGCCNDFLAPLAARANAIQCSLRRAAVPPRQACASISCSPGCTFLVIRWAILRPSLAGMQIDQFCPLSFLYFLLRARFDEAYSLAALQGHDVDSQCDLRTGFGLGGMATRTPLHPPIQRHARPVLYVGIVSRWQAQSSILIW